MKTMPRFLLLLFGLSVFTMMFIARCGLNMDSQLINSRPNGLPSSATGTPGERALREVMRRKEVEHIRDKSMMQEKIRQLENQLAKVQNQVVNMTAILDTAAKQQSQGDSLNNNDNNFNNVNDNSIKNDNYIYVQDAGLDHLEEEKETLDRKWFGPAQKDFNLLENLNHIPGQPGSQSDNVNGGRRNSFWDTDSLLQRQPLPALGDGRMAQRLPAFGNGRVISTNDRNPLIDMTGRRPALHNLGRGADQLRNGPVNNVRYMSPEEIDRLKLERVGGPIFPRDPINFDSKPFDHRRVDFGMAAVDRHALGLREDQISNELSRRQNVKEMGRLPHSAPAGEAAVGPGKVFMDSALGLDKNAQHSLNTAQHLELNKNAFFQTPSYKAEEHARYIQERMDAAEIFHGQAYKTEFEVIPFNRFIINRIYMVDPGLGKRVVERPIGSKKKDVNEILLQAVEALNRNRSDSNLPKYTFDHFVEGIYRSDPASGAHYELYFVNLDDGNVQIPSGLRSDPNHQQYLYTNSYVRLSMFRPFSPPVSVKQHVIKTGPDWINLILPLSGRVDTFKVFMDQFEAVCIKQDRRVYLTVVYFGTEGLTDVKAIMSRTAKMNKFKHMKLVTLNETFTRGRGLQIGALNWRGGADVLMFFCDVDIMFMPEFLERCRLNSEKGKRVYYPIVFSLYNPKIVYSLQDLPMPSLQEQLVLSKDTGFWRDFGYGMTCQYRSDFLKIKGFDEQITGWGGEDVLLYQKFIRSEYFVVRATDPAIFHLWHEKFCDPNLSAQQYRSCIRSKALNEASHSQLGLLAFKDEIDVHRSVNEKNVFPLGNAALGQPAASYVNSNEAMKKQQQFLNAQLKP
ncbi:hexosyltransferase [Plakobranchus ocellatus]|uniref:Hexosyltransferase n=1 Tax=Plakobranchus ocellatus TaxID=259542 RepID=A0AAV4D5G3_9GAST|nr:hexosyltransferase [Plakobranchus ocellatus]